MVVTKWDLCHQAVLHMGGAAASLDLEDTSVTDVNHLAIMVFQIANVGVLIW